VDEAVTAVRGSGFARARGTVVICYTSDVMGAGVRGEKTWLLRSFLFTGPGFSRWKAEGVVVKDRFPFRCTYILYNR
jgi:hypothetical protein